ncbi:hypothetical protein LUZ60_013765 [Juncus effusus]|nr:hypothetical protein LUZ60_013765 [Juncus effusus]
MANEISEVEMLLKIGDAVMIDIEDLMGSKKKRHDTANVSEKRDGVTNEDQLAQEFDPLLDERSVTIFRVPIYRESMKRMMEPKMVAIGPYHHGKQALRPLEKHKRWYLRDFLARTPDIGIEVYLREMRAMEKAARECYDDVIEMSTDEFALMLLLDGCFILEYFLKFENKDPGGLLNAKNNQANDLGLRSVGAKIKVGQRVLPIQSKKRSKEPNSITNVGWDTVYLDLIMMENQIPYSIIHKLGTIFYSTVDHNCKDECPVCHLVYKRMGFDDMLNSNSPKLPCSQINHLLHLYHLRMTPPIATDKDQTSDPNQTSSLDQTSNPDQTSDPNKTSSPDQISNLDQTSVPNQISSPDQTSNSDTKNSLSINARCLFWLFWLWSTFLPEKARQCLSWFQSRLVRRSKEAYFYRIHSATELHEAGVRFKKKNKPCNIFDITLENGVMEIPYVCISEGTKTLFTNVLLYEQSQDGKIPATLGSYLILMDFLMDNGHDVALLKRCGSIGNLLPTDEEVALFFNDLCDYTIIDLDESYYDNLTGEVLKYINLPWHSYRAMLVHDYFSNPWAIISLFAATLLLLLTTTQTVFSIYPVAHPN